MKKCIVCDKPFTPYRSNNLHCGRPACARKARLIRLQEQKQTEEQLSALEHFALSFQFPDFYDVVRPICHGVLAKKRRCLKCQIEGSFDNGYRTCETCRVSNAKVGRMASC